MNRSSMLEYPFEGMPLGYSADPTIPQLSLFLSNFLKPDHLKMTKKAIFKGIKRAALKQKS